MSALTAETHPHVLWTSRSSPSSAAGSQINWTPVERGQAPALSDGFCLIHLSGDTGGLVEILGW